MIFLLSRVPHHKCAREKLILNRDLPRTVSENFTHWGWGMQVEMAYDPYENFYFLDK
jgi:hypothetical protein